MSIQIPQNYIYSGMQNSPTIREQMHSLYGVTPEEPSQSWLSVFGFPLAIGGVMAGCKTFIHSPWLNTRKGGAYEGRGWLTSSWKKTAAEKADFKRVFGTLNNELQVQGTNKFTQWVKKIWYANYGTPLLEGEFNRNNLKGKLRFVPRGAAEAAAGKKGFWNGTKKMFGKLFSKGGLWFSVALEALFEGGKVWKAFTDKDGGFETGMKQLLQSGIRSAIHITGGIIGGALGTFVGGPGIGNMIGGALGYSLASKLTSIIPGLKEPVLNKKKKQMADIAASNVQNFDGTINQEKLNAIAMKRTGQKIPSSNALAAYSGTPNLSKDTNEYSSLQDLFSATTPLTSLGMMNGMNGMGMGLGMNGMGMNGMGFNGGNMDLGLLQMFNAGLYGGTNPMGLNGAGLNGTRLNLSAINSTPSGIINSNPFQNTTYNSGIIPYQRQFA